MNTTPDELKGETTKAFAAVGDGCQVAQDGFCPGGTDLGQRSGSVKALAGNGGGY